CLLSPLPPTTTNTPAILREALKDGSLSPDCVAHPLTPDQKMWLPTPAEGKFVILRDRFHSIEVCLCLVLCWYLALPA
ncbi:hypothetical protein GBAR_LOCUS3966, partial [Geodia barretti]